MSRTSTIERMSLKSLYKTFCPNNIDQEKLEIKRHCVDDNTYFVTYVQKYQNYLSSSDCQLIFYYDKNGDHFLGYAYESDGFPMTGNRHPCFQETVKFKNIQELKFDKEYLKIQSKQSDEIWWFKFFKQQFLMKDRWMNFFKRMEENKKTIETISQMTCSRKQLEKGGFAVLEKIFGELQKRDICLKQQKNLIGFQAIRQKKKLEKFEKLDSLEAQIQRLSEENNIMKDRLGLHEIKSKNYHKVSYMQQLQQQTKNLKKEVEHVEAKLNYSLRKLEKKQEKIDKISQYLQERQEDDQKLRNLLKQLLTFEQSMSQNNNVLFNSLASTISIRFNKDLSSYLEGMDSIRKFIGHVDSSVNFSSGYEMQQRWSADEPNSQSAMIDRVDLSRSANYAEMPVVSEGESTFHRMSVSYQKVNSERPPQLEEAYLKMLENFEQHRKQEIDE